MKTLVKTYISLFGVGIYRLPQDQNGAPPKLIITSPLAHNSKEGLNAFYADQKTAESYLNLPFYEHLVDFLHDQGITYDGKHVADIGCGVGHLLKLIADNYQPASLNGLEYSEAALAIARARLPSARIDYFDVYETPGGKFDVLFCVEVLEHLLYPRRALSNLLKMIDAGGAALVTVPNGRTDTFEGHINFWSPESWDAFIRETCAGFEVSDGLLEDGTVNFAIIKSMEN